MSTSANGGGLGWRPRFRDGALALVLGLAVFLRFWAIDWGAPYLYHPDEHLILQPALTIVRDGDVNPHWFQYPSLLIYLQAAVVAGAQPFVRAPLTTDAVTNRIGPWDALPAQWPFALGGRLVVAGFAVAGVWLMYRLGARYTAPAAGIAAALFLVSAPLHNESSHYLTTDIPAATIMTAALLCAVRSLPSASLRSLAAAGFFAGLAAATKYTAGIVLFVPLAVAASWPLRDSGRRAALIGLAAAAAFLIACPFALLDSPALWHGIVEQRRNYLRGFGGAGNWRWYLRYLYANGLGAPLAVLSALGLLAQVVTALWGWAGLKPVPAPEGGLTVGNSGTSARRRLGLSLILVPAGYFALIASYPSRVERNLILLLPFICLLAADLCWRIAHRVVPTRAAPVACVLAASLVALPGLLACVQHDRQLARPDTRTVALQWIEAQVVPGSRIAREEYTPQLSADDYDVTYLWSLAFRPYDWYVQQRFDYLVVSSNVFQRALNPPYVAGPAGPPFYRFLFEHVPLAAEFAPSLERPGPVVRVYKRSP